MDEENRYKRYFYKGMIYGSFDKTVEEYWIGETLAPSKKKAFSNLRYQFCKERGLHPYTYLCFDPKSLICEEQSCVTEHISEDPLEKEESECQRCIQLKLF